MRWNILPELPEVETIRSGLEVSVMGGQVRSVEVIHTGSIKEVTIARFRRTLAGATLSSFDRRGKFLIISLDVSDALIVDFRMTGQLIHEGDQGVLPPHTHVVFRMVGGTRLRFTDTRKFGSIRLVRADQVCNHPALSKLGVDAMGDDLTTGHLANLTAASKRPIKQLLMDQRRIAGIGNIYASEILFHAGIHPQTEASSLKPEAIRILRSSIRHILRVAIRRCGTTMRDFRTASGGYGNYQNEFRVYARENRPCRRCATPVVRIRQHGRSTFFCPQCQQAE
ncbi:MAG: formamidopyrimidine-DNA glycosylase [Armatimonadetes bacterium CG07_land_8_20_14_0_80_59_28]|nr:MAG: formamidopyrimidine-DNA glycosylase [Armatimonadetes bacterium CG07_land_8_20_14_0_80_59_28]PIX44856.1 MAG: formamidopyrimidine-DNA glycosylase [Armatimonadetes bacterium CG_4_8_14_3_um_filter_58_9]PJB72471.1 MAG: formamidopyrimidine-DNA glycosylase [Armatimonadetes bacterium CG_4_9_14_3_um_filter_58_7]